MHVRNSGKFWILYRSVYIYVYKFWTSRKSLNVFHFNLQWRRQAQTHLKASFLTRPLYHTSELAGRLEWLTISSTPLHCSWIPLSLKPRESVLIVKLLPCHQSRAVARRDEARRGSCYCCRLLPARQPARQAGSQSVHNRVFVVIANCCGMQLQPLETNENPQPNGVRFRI